MKILRNKTYEYLVECTKKYEHHLETSRRAYWDNRDERLLYQAKRYRKSIGSKPYKPTKYKDL